MSVGFIFVLLLEEKGKKHDFFLKKRSGTLGEYLLDNSFLFWLIEINPFPPNVPF